MLTDEQKKMMEGILTANDQIQKDRVSVAQIADFDPSNGGSFDVKSINVTEPYKQCVTISNTQTSPLNIFIYTDELIKGFGYENVTAANTALDDRELNEVTNKLSELKNII